MTNNLGFEIDFLPVGNNSKGGDAIAIRFGEINSETPNQKIIIIDGGYKETGEKLKKLVKNTYKSNVIDLVILTHPDQDHASGLRVLFEDKELKIRKLVMHRPWLNDKINTSYFKDKRKTEKSLNKDLQNAFYFAFDLAELASEKIGETNISEPKVGSSYLNGVLKILGPSYDLYRNSLIESDKTPEPIGSVSERKFFSKDIVEFEKFNEGDDIEWYDDETTSPVNETSVISLFEYLGNKIILTGDVGKKGLDDAFNYASDKKISLDNLKVFQIPHHGSRKNLSPDIIDSFNSSFCFISCPPEGDPKHPSRRLLNLLNQKGRSVYTTSGIQLHWGVNYPDRNWNTCTPIGTFDQIEK